jgi:hypothetical protein
VVRGEKLGALRRCRDRTDRGVHRGGANGSMVVLVLTRERVGMAFIVGREAVTVFLARHGE